MQLEQPVEVDEGLGRPRLVKGRLHGKIFLIPSFITVIAIFCGFYALIAAIKGRFDHACLAIGLALILDALDGRVARRLNATSEFGREIDSLSDIVSFGVAPAILIYQWAFNGLADDFGLLVSFLFVACGASRLARFNVMAAAPLSEQKKHFVGLPIPAAAVALTTIVYFNPAPLTQWFSVSAVMTYTIATSLLMVSTFTYFSPKYVRLTSGNIRQYIILFSIAVAAVWYNSRVLIPLGFFLYVLSGPVWWVFRGRAVKK